MTSAKSNITTLQNDVKTAKTDIGTLKTDVGKIKTDQGTLATKTYVDSKREVLGDWDATKSDKTLPETGTVFGGKHRSVHKTGSEIDVYTEFYTRKNVDGDKSLMARLHVYEKGKACWWDFSTLYGGTMIFPGTSGYLKMGNCLMSYGNRVNNSLIKFDYTDSLQIKYANHGSTMTINTQGTAHAGVTAKLWGNSSRPVVYEVGVDAGLYMFYGQKNTDNTYEFQVNGACHATAFNQTSDRDLKDNIQVIDNATDRIRKMNGYTYTMKENGLPYAGIIAQEALEAIPEVVGSMMKYKDGGSGSEGEEGERYYTVDYSGVTGLLVQVARETDDRVTALENRIAHLETLITK
ncbi:TPA: tail fiber domain-containing protein [Escherichia coli]|uniref:tail fiber domain-containing protein n=1 Tax=Escherichia coli TaxID=562 RepID=UPI0028859930|nr:tail fiber domain-containing protein [Escherichia coli]EIX2076568.1 tail fiber domain-containing protein [Escherichia coli]EJJ3047914.1 tail fiber domain-containing protein [Escherichia coli]EKX4972823.1 tail fiber domain-containing protein [Escherichia coli]ELJ8325540.1 tail fiber domain-containing protein [Escherichia coli]